MFAGTLVLLGWALDIALLKSLSPEWVSMKANTAACFALLGYALWSLMQPVLKQSLLQPAGRLAALLAALIGLLTLLEYQSGWGLGIDQLLFSEPAGTIGTFMPGRMAPDSALSFLLLGVTLLITGMEGKFKTVHLASAAASLLVAVFALASLLAYLTPVLGAYGWFGFTVMAMHTALLFLLLGMAVTWLCWQRSGLPWSLSKPVTLAILCGLIWLALVGLNTMRSQLWLRANIQQVAYSEMVLGDLQGILIAAVDAQAHARGYVITGKPDFRGRFLDARAEALAKIRALTPLVRDTPLEQQQLDQLESQVRINMQWLEQAINTEQRNAERISMTVHGEELLDALREKLTNIEIRHQSHITELKAKSLQVAYFANLFIVIGTLSSMLVFLISLLKLNSTETRNHRLSNLYAALSQCNQAIVHLDNTAQLFPQICLDAVRFGGMKMAWIGILDEAGKQVTVAASFGEGADTLDDLSISLDADDPSGSGPAGIAIRNNQPCWCQDFQHDPASLPWHERAALFGWGSAAALPLQCNGVVVGAFSLYAAETGAFDAAARHLLVEMASDISYALGVYADNAERKVLQANLREQQALVEMAENLAHIGGWSIELANMHLVWSDEVCAIHEVPAGTQPTLEQGINFYPPGSREIISAAVDACIRLGKPFDLELQIVTAKQHLIWVHAIGQAERDEQGVITRVQGAFQDITELKRIADEKYANDVRYQLLFDSMVTGFGLHEILCDEQGKPVDYRFLEVNPAFEALTDLKAEHIIGHTALEVMPGLESFWIERYGEVALTQQSTEFEHYNEAMDKHFHVVAYAPRHGQFVTLFSDITERKQAEERIEHLARFDQLTGLPNRTLLNDRVRYAISMAQRNNEHLALMFIDLDRFKDINDTLGHDVGDVLLLQVAEQLKSAMREEDTVARLGGDEFILLLPGTDHQGAANVAGKLLSIFSRARQVGGQEIVVTPSIGIAMYPGDGESFDELSKSADTAMYRTKQAGRNDFSFFAQEMQLDTRRALLLSNALRHALQSGQLQLHYQPQVSMSDGKLIGAEALLRWQHPELGAISPGEFIPIAEASGQIITIGDWVLRTAVQQLKVWMDDGMAPMVMAVNLSALQFSYANFPDRVTQILEEAGVAPQYLELELTEGVAMDDPQLAITTMNDLYERGVRMSIDDFGTGYSSLSYLKRFNVYKLKIDQSFVRDISSDSEDKAIVAAIISMAASLGMKTIAEGVETAEQLAFLRLQGCNEVQGYYFSKPLPAEQFEAYARAKQI